VSKLRSRHNYDEHEPVQVEKLVQGGQGMGFIGGKPVFIPMVAPGDVVIPVSIRKGRKVLFAKPGKLIERSQLRREPPCPWFGECGGCDWMHLTPENQILWKDRIFRETMRRLAGLNIHEPVKVSSTFQEFGWRHRIRLQHHQGRWGFFRRETHDIVQWDECMLLPDVLNRAVDVIRRISGEAMELPKESVEITVSPDDARLTLNWIFTARSDIKSSEKFLDLAQNSLEMEGITISGQAISIPGNENKILKRGSAITHKSGGVTTYASPGTFTQVNPEVNNHLVESVLGILKEKGCQHLLDLYCGNGNFSVPASSSGIRVTGVEWVRQAIKDAKLAKAEKGEFIASDVEEYLDNIPGSRFDTVLVDPPRTGLSSGAMKSLISQKIPDMVYVSCDPATLARDLKILVKSGYEIEDIQIFDMFPNSSHIESLVCLKG